jgi:hypothetical protein
MLKVSLNTFLIIFFHLLTPHFAHHQDQTKVVSLSELSRISSLPVPIIDLTTVLPDVSRSSSSLSSSCSLSTLKRYADEEEQEEDEKQKKKKDQGVLTDLTFYGHQQFQEEVRKLQLICYTPN